MVKLPKRVAANVAAVEQRPYNLKEAVAIVKDKANAKFNETVECAVRTGLDTRHADQQIRTTFSFPHGTGKPKRVLVFVKGEAIEQAREAGADFIGADDLIEKIKEGWFEFDVAIATPEMMKDVGKLGKLLGTRGLMPNPKLGTVTSDLGNAVREFKAGKVELRAEKGGIIHCPVGKADFDADKLEENVDALVRFILRNKPAGSKGEYVKTVSLSSTMGPGVRVDLGEFTS